MRRKRLLSSISLVIITGGLVLGIWGVSTHQRVRNYASFPQCPDNSASCRWDPLGSGVRYRYILRDVTDNRTLSEGETANWWLRYTPIVNHEYLCQVTPVTTCGSGPMAEVRTACAVPSPTATPGLAANFLHPKSGSEAQRTVSPEIPSSPTPTELQNLPVEPVKKTPLPIWKDWAVLTNVATYLLLTLLIGCFGFIGWQAIQRRRVSGKKPPPTAR